MINNSKLKSLAFTTTRLEVANAALCLDLESARSELLSAIVSLLTPLAVKSLPPYFHDIKTKSQAGIWLDKILSESHLFTINLENTTSVIGFVFLYESDNAVAHLGYLLGENFWQQGYGYELLLGLIVHCRAERIVDKLIAGVEAENIASAKLLEKVGFILNHQSDNGVTFYEYSIP